MASASWVHNLNKFVGHIRQDPENFPLMVVTGGTVVYFFAAMARRYLVVQEDAQAVSRVNPLTLHRESIQESLPYIIDAAEKPTIRSDKTIKDPHAKPSPATLAPTRD